ncbi:MAG: hypothetical protein Q6353_018125 [Candidatus Sigynarchaeum springense]
MASFYPSDNSRVLRLDPAVDMQVFLNIFLSQVFLNILLSQTVKKCHLRKMTLRSPFRPSLDARNRIDALLLSETSRSFQILGYSNEFLFLS